MQTNQRKKWIILLVVVLVIVALGVVALRSWPAIGSQLANPLRQVLGVRAVAQLETALFVVQDNYEQLKVRLGLAEQQSPFAQSEAPPPENLIEPGQPSPTAVVQADAPQLTETPLQEKTPEAEANIPAATSTPAATPTPSGWTLSNLEPFGDVQGEGVWQPYLYNSAGEVVAMRTFLQPDPERPYALVAVVAFDMQNTGLNYVLGTKEPAKPNGPHGDGIIPLEDRQPGKLLAAFNGGFIAEHGGYGAMANGLTTLALSQGLATLAIFPDGELSLGEWGTDLALDGEYSALRQNALMILHNGEINEKVYTGTWVEWGANLDYSTATLRSGIGLSEDNQVLYYFAGPSLSMPVLADAMQRAGVHNSMLLDINPTHAHFTAMRVEDGELVAEALYPEVMDLWVDRYLRQWEQDFFYVVEGE